MNTEDQITIRFLVDVDKHCNVKVVGNIDALGQWDPAAGLRTRWLTDTLFESEITISKNEQNRIEYKYVSCPDNPADLKWEDGDNRILDVSNSNFLQAQDYFQIDDRCNQLSDGLMNFDKTFGRTIEQKKTITSLLSDHALVRFQVAAGTKDPRDAILICGNSKQLDRVTMQYTYPKWELDVLVPLVDFPIQYKYATLTHWKTQVPTQAVVEETRNTRTIELPTKTSNYTRIMVQLHDKYCSQSLVTRFTTPVTHSHLQNWIKIRSRAYLDPVDNKAVVSCNYDMYSAQKFYKPFKIRNSSRETYMISNINEDTWQLLFDALTDSECSLPRIEFRDASPTTSTPVSTHEIEMFSDMLEHNQSFTELIVLSRALAVNKLRDAIGSHKCLKNLEVYGALTAELCAPLGHILARSKTIYYLTLLLEDLATFFSLAKYLNMNTTRVYSLRLVFSQVIANISAEEANQFRDAFKYNRTITNLVVSIENNSPLRKALSFDDDFFEVNWSLTHLQSALFPAESQVANYLARNKQYQQNMLAKMVTILYNLVRAREDLEAILPIEIWLLVFSFVQYPGRQLRFDVIFAKLLDDATVRRVID